DAAPAPAGVAQRLPREGEQAPARARYGRAVRRHRRGPPRGLRRLPVDRRLEHGRGPARLHGPAWLPAGAPPAPGLGTDADRLVPVRAGTQAGAAAGTLPGP